MGLQKQKISDGVNKFFQSKKLSVVTYAVAGLIVALAIFKTGVAVGYEKARFSYKWGENYHRNFAGPRKGFFEDFSGRDFIEAYGVFGQIMKIDTSTTSKESTLIVRGRDDVEKTVLVKDGVIVKRFKENIKPADLKIDDPVVVIGNPNDAGQIEAKLIRLMPPRPLKTPPEPIPRRMR